MPVVSIIIPVYNPGNYLQKSVPSILASKLKDIELILVDDGCTDGGGKRCDEWADLDARIRVVHKPNGGISSARNAGLKIATGEFVAFVDQDDTVSSDMYEKLYANAQNDCEVSFCNFDLIYPDHTEIYHTYSIYSDHVQTYKDMLLHGYGGNIWNMIIRRSLVEKFNIHFPEHLRHCEDIFFTWRLHAHATKYAKLEDALYHYNLSNVDQVSNHLDFRFVQCLMQCIDETLDYLQGYNLRKLYELEFTSLILQAKTNFVMDSSKYDLVQTWHPEANQYIDNCPLLGSKMKFMMKLIANHHYVLASLLTKVYNLRK